MIPVPKSVLESLAQSFGTVAGQLDRFGGGLKESDGVVYAYPHQDSRRLLKIMAIPIVNQQNGLFCLKERMSFVRFLGEHGAPIVFPRISPQGNLYETWLSDAHLWVGYSMDIAPGVAKKETTWDPDFFRNWGEALGMLHRLTQQYPSWEASVDP